MVLADDCYPCRDDIFRATYEHAVEAQHAAGGEGR